MKGGVCRLVSYPCPVYHQGVKNVTLTVSSVTRWSVSLVSVTRVLTPADQRWEEWTVQGVKRNVQVRELHVSLLFARNLMDISTGNTT